MCFVFFAQNRRKRISGAGLGLLRRNAGDTPRAQNRHPAGKGIIFLFYIGAQAPGNRASEELLHSEEVCGMGLCVHGELHGIFRNDSFFGQELDDAAAAWQGQKP